MELTSNDAILLEEFYNQLKRERISVTLEKIPVEDAMGIIPTIEIKSSDFTSMVKDMFTAWLEYKKFKLYIDSKEVSMDNFDQLNENSKIKIEFRER